MNVVRRVLKWETEGQDRGRKRPGFSRCEYIQSQALAKSCRQKIDGGRIDGKKADFALSFSPQHPVVEREYKAINAGQQGPVLLSQMNDVCTSRLVIYSGFEVKKLGGPLKTAQGQIFTFCGGGTIRLRQLLKKVGSGTPTKDLTLPLLGWTVLGDSWELYIFIGKGNEEKDPIFAVGPIHTCTCDTSTYFGTFKLMRLIERVTQWARETYWPWYCKTVIEPLKSLGGIDTSSMEDEDMAEMGEAMSFGTADDNANW